MILPPFDLATARQRIAVAYSPALLERAAAALMHTLAAHLERVEARETKVLNWREPKQLLPEARQMMHGIPLSQRAGPGEGEAAEPRDEDLIARLCELAREMLARGQNMHSPRYVGHQVPASVPLASLFDLVGTMTNQVMAIYEMGPWATAVEHAVIDAVGETLGFKPSTFAGLITSGGTLANLTGLLAARNVALGDAWSKGLAGRQPAPVLVVHADSHYSVTRSAGILGLGTNQVVAASLDPLRRIDPGRLEDTLRGLRQRGVPIVAVSAAACATPIGAFDPLEEVADVCAKYEVWLHVDAAHGGPLAFSPRHRHLLRGIERADTVVCDAHKMMFMPALCAMLFYRNRAHRLAPFHQEAPYLFDPLVPELAEYDSGVANLECTKRAAAFGTWGIWSLFGSQLFADMVEATLETARAFHALLVAANDFEPLHEPQCNIVAFRYMPEELRAAPPAAVDLFQLRLRRSVVESGEYYLVQCKLEGRPVLRTTIMNPLTTPDDLQGLMDCLRQKGAVFLR